MAASLDMIAEDGNNSGSSSSPVAEVSAARQLLEYRQRTRKDLGDFIPLREDKQGAKSVESKNSLDYQLTTSSVGQVKYWKGAGATKGSTKKPTGKKSAQRQQKASAYMDRLRAKAEKSATKARRKKR